MRKFTIKTAWNEYGQTINTVLRWSREELEADFKESKSSRNWLTEKDYMWGLFNKMLCYPSSSLTDMHFRNKTIYLHMAWFVSDYEGKSGLQYSKLMIQEGIKEIQASQKSSELVYEINVVPDPDCPHAKKISSKTYLVESEDLPLADENCTRQVCRCCLAGIPKLDENEDFVLKKKIETFDQKRNQATRKKGFWSRLFD